MEIKTAEEMRKITEDAISSRNVDELIKENLECIERFISISAEEEKYSVSKLIEEVVLRIRQLYF